MIKNPNDIVDKLTSDYQSVFGDKLVSVVMYGCAVTHEYIPGSSTINIFLLVTDASLKFIQKCTAVHKYWLRRGVTTPLIMSRDFFQASLDIYPVDYLHIQSSYRVLYGEDVFSALDIQRNHLLSQCQRELKEMSLQLRTEFLLAGNRKHVISELLNETVNRLFPLFKALLVLNGLKIPHSSSELISSIEDLFGLGVSILSDVYNGKRRLESDCIRFYERLTDVVDLMAVRVTQIKIRESQSSVV